MYRKEESIEERQTDVRIIYYSHPLETYRTFLEILVEKAVRKQFEEIYHMDEFNKIKSIEVINDEKLIEIFIQMRKLINKYKNKIPETDAKEIAHSFMKILKLSITTKCNILFNPSIFSNIFSIGVISEEFKRKAYPFFCQGLIDYCDVIVAHGYIMDNYITELFKSWLKLLMTFDQIIREYSSEILRLIEFRNTLLSPGVYHEMKYAIEKGKKVLLLQINENLKEVTVDNLDSFKVIPFDKYGLKLYNKLWQPIAESVYQTLTQLNYDNYIEI
ncbi:MAG: hypothetical protein QXI58_07505 [Candidatus Micrarchaeia archaeon]